MDKLMCVICLWHNKKDIKGCLLCNEILCLDNGEIHNCIDCNNFICSKCVVFCNDRYNKKIIVNCTKCYIDSQQCNNIKRKCSECKSSLCYSRSMKYKKQDMGLLNNYCEDCITDYGVFNTEQIELCNACV